MLWCEQIYRNTVRYSIAVIPVFGFLFSIFFFRCAMKLVVTALKRYMILSRKGVGEKSANYRGFNTETSYSAVNAADICGPLSEFE